MLSARTPEATSCDTCLLGKSSQCFVKSTLDEHVISRCKKVRHVKANTVIWNESGRTDTVGMIVKGVLRVTQTTEDGKRKILGLHLPSDFFGNLYSKFANCGLEAASDAQVCFFDQTEFEHLIETYPRLKQKVLLATLGQLNAARDFAALIAAHRTSERIARFFVACARPDRTNDAYEIHLPIGRRDLAALVNTTPETVCRFITDLVQRKVLLRRTDAIFSVSDAAELEDIAGRTLAESAPRTPVLNPATKVNASIANERTRTNGGSGLRAGKFTTVDKVRSVLSTHERLASVENRRGIDS